MVLVWNLNPEKHRLENNDVENLKLLNDEIKQILPFHVSWQERAGAKNALRKPKKSRELEGGGSQFTSSVVFLHLPCSSLYVRGSTGFAKDNLQSTKQTEGRSGYSVARLTSLCTVGTDREEQGYFGKAHQ
jgi:hypothetical protein